MTTLTMGTHVYGAFDWVDIGLVEGSMMGMHGADIYSAVQRNYSSQAAR